MPMYDVYGARRAAEVTRDTWGHLAPEAEREYIGWILCALGCFGDYVVIDYDFVDLPDSPWLAEDMYAWLGTLDLTEGKAYRFTGSYARRQFTGRTEPISLLSAG